MQHGLKLKYYPYTLELRHTFTVASNSRTTTPVVLTEIEYEGHTGYGEASLPPYLEHLESKDHGALSGSRPHEARFQIVVVGTAELRYSPSQSLRRPGYERISPVRRSHTR